MEAKFTMKLRQYFIVQNFKDFENYFKRVYFKQNVNGVSSEGYLKF